MSSRNMKSAPIQENRLSSGQKGHIMSPLAYIQTAIEPGQPSGGVVKKAVVAGDACTKVWG